MHKLRIDTVCLYADQVKASCTFPKNTETSRTLLFAVQLRLIILMQYKHILKMPYKVTILAFFSIFDSIFLIATRS